MWKPSRYPEHNASLARWIAKFNAADPLDITARMYEEEQFVHDGTIDLWSVLLNYDWEKRQDWAGEKFPFNEVGQFERKFDQEKQIHLAIMCNLAETHFLTAWHDRFKQKVAVSRKTDFALKEQGIMRVSNEFKTFSYAEMWLVKKWLLNTYPVRIGTVKVS